jgi:hypothetical protein
MAIFPELAGAITGRRLSYNNYRFLGSFFSCGEQLGSIPVRFCGAIIVLKI